MGSDLILVSASFIGAHLLRFVGFPFLPNTTQFFVLLLVVAVVKGALFRWCQLYRGLWRHAGMPEAIRLIQASSLASVGARGEFLVLRHDAPLPIAVRILDWMLTLATTAGRRFGQRALTQYPEGGTGGTKQIQFYGADRYGVFLLRYLRHTAPAQYSVVGFYDPAPSSHELKGLPIVTAAEAIDADTITVPILPDSETNKRNCNQIFADCAQLDLDCHQFQLSISVSDTTPTKQSSRMVCSKNEQS